MKTKRSFLFASILLTIITALACNFSGFSGSDQATSTATSEATPTRPSVFEVGPGSSIPIPVAQATGTVIAQALEATQQAQQSVGEEVRSATSVAFTPLLAELPKYGIDPARGRPGWIHPPITLETEGYQQFQFTSDFLDVIAQDFIASTDITWNTEYANSGCGFVVRSDGNRDAYNQYMVIITRVVTGHAVVVTVANGQVVNIRDLYASGIDPLYNWKSDTTNRLTVVGRGNLLTVYTNGARLGEINPSEPPPGPELPPPPQPPTTNSKSAQAEYKKAKADYNKLVEQLQAEYRERVKLLQSVNTVFERGFIAMLAVTESGYTRCQFNNTWLWLIE